MTDTMTNGKDWAEEEGLRIMEESWNHHEAIATALRAAEARGIERAADEVKYAIKQYQHTSKLALQVRTVLKITLDCITSLLPADKKGGGR